MCALRTGNPVPAAVRFSMYYKRHKDLILQSKRELAPVLIQQKKVSKQMESYSAALARVLRPLTYEGRSPAETSSAKASVALLAQAHVAAERRRYRLSQLLHNARKGQSDFRAQYHALFKAAQDGNAVAEQKLQRFLSDRRAACVDITTLVEAGIVRRGPRKR